MATFSAYSTGPTTGYATLSGLSVVNYDRTVYINVNGLQQLSWVILANATPASSYQQNFTGLIANTDYEARCVVYRNSDWAIVYSTTDLFITYWEWINPKALDGNFNITPTEWLNFINRIDSVRSALGFSVYPFTKTPSFFVTGQPFYAFIFTQACNAIHEMNGQIPLELRSVTTESNMFNWYFDTLKAALNNAIKLV